jgi:hypothetical protein
MTDHRRGHDALIHPQSSQRVLDHERRRLHHRRRQQRLRVIGEQALTQVEAEFARQRFDALVHGGTERGLAGIQSTPHAGIRGALAREHEDDIAAARRSAAHGGGIDLGRVQRCCGARCGLRRDGEAMRKHLASHGQRPCHIAQAHVRVLLQVTSEVDAARANAVGVRAGKHQQLRDRGRAPTPAAAAPPPARRARWFRRRRSELTPARRGTHRCAAMR